MKLSRREIFTAAVSISIISIILYMVYFYQPFISEARILTDQLHSLKLDIEDSRNLETKIKNLNNELLSLRSEFNFLYAHSFEGAEQAEVILFLEKQINPYGVKKSISFTKPEEYGAYKVAKVVLSIETNFTNLIMILKGIEQAPWSSRIEKIKAARKNRDSSISRQYDLEVEMTVGFYIL